MRPFYTLVIILTSVLIAACSPSVSRLATPISEPQERFFASLKGLCGSRFEGKMTYPIEGQDAFAGKVLAATFASCSENEIRIPFVVGEDKSRTWIISKTRAGLQLKHDHRHADGTPDKINMYGGLASGTGTPLSQSFAADTHTAKIIPAASTNVWTLSLSADTQELTYFLERHSASRFRAVLQKVKR